MDPQALKPLAYYSKPVVEKSISARKPEQRPDPPKPKKPKAETTAAKQQAPAARRSTVKTKPIEQNSPSGNQNVTASSKWRWPAAGKVVTRFALQQGKKGIDIRGRVGQPILATAGGEVVYSGKGLIGYGNMVIIKHSDTYLSAYGHNRRLLVGEGERVGAGQKIAEMGQRSKSGSILHFEIRKNGRPVDPMRYLPTKN
ncbi:peptidoglycan DD-metalloendopeptidase family protein [Thiohalomonas denitrificans]|uniref:peptidoglycan DD-metalloendopeptidase family protein n=1 Tax=Thiohalomonas denitrificans TaxID=415747 RepID=UPI001FDFC93D|nr:peptidoglycan DD-metalloendopeptidase family protein [Thiohalomonas denitrificans]